VKEDLSYRKPGESLDKKCRRRFIRGIYDSGRRRYEPKLRAANGPSCAQYNSSPVVTNARSVQTVKTLMIFSVKNNESLRVERATTPPRQVVILSHRSTNASGVHVSGHRCPCLHHYSLCTYNTRRSTRDSQTSGPRQSGAEKLNRPIIICISAAGRALNRSIVRSLAVRSLPVVKVPVRKIWSLE